MKSTKKKAGREEPGAGRGLVCSAGPAAGTSPPGPAPTAPCVLLEWKRACGLGQDSKAADDIWG